MTAGLSATSNRSADAGRTGIAPGSSRPSDDHRRKGITSMKIGSMLGEILHSVFRRTATVQYPYARTPVPSRLRGMILFNPEKCTGCALCMKDCPSNAIEIIAVDKPNKRFIMRLHLDRCTFCAQCIVNCNFKCLEMTNEQWENAALKRKAFVVTAGRDEDLKKFLEATAHPIPEKEA
jgi:formate hydrogenlyase subunit 6/NADH:ubiquinone oxidoreductase subunit I